MNRRLLTWTLVLLTTVPVSVRASAGTYGRTSQDTISIRLIVPPRFSVTAGPTQRSATPILCMHQIGASQYSLAVATSPASPATESRAVIGGVACLARDVRNAIVGTRGSSSDSPVTIFVVAQ